MARSWLTATSTSWVPAILLPQPPEQLALQVPATMPEMGFRHVGQAGLELLTSGWHPNPQYLRVYLELQPGVPSYTFAGAPVKQGGWNRGLEELAGPSQLHGMEGSWPGRAPSLPIVSHGPQMFTAKEEASGLTMPARTNFCHNKRSRCPDYHMTVFAFKVIKRIAVNVTCDPSAAGMRSMTQIPTSLAARDEAEEFQRTQDTLPGQTVSRLQSPQHPGTLKPRVHSPPPSRICVAIKDAGTCSRTPHRGSEVSVMNRRVEGGRPGASAVLRAVTLDLRVPPRVLLLCQTPTSLSLCRYFQITINIERKAIGREKFASYIYILFIL
ncbi:hypothetical protein AAY473_019802 [Plecturocebus cupreus]